MMTDPTLLYPSVTSIPGQSGQAERALPKKPEGTKSEFDHVLEKQESKTQDSKNLDQVKAPLKFSAHASQRLSDRKIQLDAQTMQKVNEAIDKAEAKGVDDTLVLTKDAALIVSVKNRTVITAMDKNSMSGNV